VPSASVNCGPTLFPSPELSMCDQNNTVMEPNEKWYNWRPPVSTRHYVEIAILAGYIIFDGYGVFPSNHFVGILSVVLLVWILLFPEMVIWRWLTFTGVSAVLSALLYLYVGPTPPPPPIIGWLQPANDPIPDNGCGTNLDREGKHAVLLLVGDSGYIMPNLNSTTEAVTLGWCRSLTLHSTDNGITIDAQIFAQDGKKVGSLEDNGYHIDGDLIVEKDLNTIVVHDPSGKELIWVRYLNDRTIRVRGNFFCSAPHPISIKITNHSIVDPNRDTFSRECFRLGPAARFVAVWR
jgi:hypothetical protein